MDGEYDIYKIRYIRYERRSFVGRITVIEKELRDNSTERRGSLRSSAGARELEFGGCR